MSEIKRQSKRAKFFRTIFFLLTAFFSVFLSCGIDEYYYLPQVPQENIERTLNTGASVVLPSITDYYGAQNYIIYYRIYISNESIGSEITDDIINRELISSALRSEYNALSSVVNPTTTSLPSVNTFSSLKYYELKFKDVEKNVILSASDILPAGGGKLEFIFPTAESLVPYVRFRNGPPVNLLRFGELLTSPASDERYFQNTEELSSYDLSSSHPDSNNFGEYYGNKDVSGLRDTPQEPHAYVSMYIVAVGYNNREFTRFFSKPTHISIFKLPNTNL